MQGGREPNTAPVFPEKFTGAGLGSEVRSRKE